MTEAVQHRFESMTDELEDMRRTNLYTDEETRIIFKKRKEFEHKIQSSSKDLKRYEEYIEYEMCLLKDVSLRRDKSKMDEKRATIEHNIVKRVKALYEMALQRFTNEVPMFLAFLKFCKKTNCINAATDTVNNFVKLHPNKPIVWKIASNWHAYDCNDINTAMVLLLQAVGQHKDSKLLHKELILLELFNVARNFALIKSSAVRLTEIIHTIFENIKDAEFYIDLLELLENHGFTIDVQNVIIKKLEEDYFDNENVWHALGQRERRGVYFVAENKSAECSPQSQSQSKTLTTKGKLEGCIAKYKEGLTKVSPEVKKKLWQLYLDFLIELQQEPFGSATVLKRTTLNSALVDAYAEDNLLEKHFIMWLERKEHKVEEASKIAENGTKAFPNSLELWKLRLKQQIVKGDSSAVDEVFKASITQLKEKSLPLWQMLLRYHYLASDEDYIDFIYKDAIVQPHEISSVLIPQYMEWLALERMDEARKIYNKVADKQPYNKDLHTMMLQLESIQLNPNYKAWEKAHELASQQFGKEDVDVWIDYMQFYSFHYREHNNPAERINTLYNQAEESLARNLLFDFRTKYKEIINS